MTAPGKPLPGAVADSLVGVLSAMNGTGPGAGERTDESPHAAALTLQNTLSELAGAPVPMRRNLPNRRAHLTVEFEHAGIRYAAGVGWFGDDPANGLAECFFNVPGKAGTTIENHARDEAISASLALQFGCPVNVLRKALTRNVDGSPSGALRHLLQILATEAGPDNAKVIDQTGRCDGEAEDEAFTAMRDDLTARRARNAAQTDQFSDRASSHSSQWSQ